jgi:hypothetical protein
VNKIIYFLFISLSSYNISWAGDGGSTRHVYSSNRIDVYIERESIKRRGDIFSASIVYDYKKRLHRNDVAFLSERVTEYHNCADGVFSISDGKMYDSHMLSGNVVFTFSPPESLRWYHPDTDESAAIFNDLCNSSIIIPQKKPSTPVYYPKEITPDSIRIEVEPTKEGSRIFDISIIYEYRKLKTLSNGIKFNRSRVWFGADCNSSEIWDEYRLDSRFDKPYDYFITGPSNGGWSSWGPEKVIRSALILACG